MGNDSSVTEADQKKINFCNEDGDFLTLINVYHAWDQVEEKKKSKWCVTNFINGKSMKMARDLVNDLKTIFKKELKIKLSLGADLDDQAREYMLLLSIFNSYRTNLCVYGGHPNVGYINLRTKEVLPIHPSSSFSYLGSITPKLIIYDQILSTSRTFLLNLSVVNEDWLNDEEFLKLEEAQKLVVSSHSIKPIGSRVLKQGVIGFKWNLLKNLEAEIKDLIGNQNFLEIQCNVEEGSITWASNSCFHSLIENIVQAKIDAKKVELSKERLEIQMIDDKTRPKIICGTGALIDDIILENEFCDIMIKDDKNFDDPEFVPELVQIARFTNGFLDVRHLSKSGNKVLMFKSFQLAKIALKILKTQAQVCHYDVDNIYPLQSSAKQKSLTGIELRIKIQRRAFKKCGFLKFPDEEEAYKTMNNVGSFVLPNCITIRPQYEKKNNDKCTLFFSLKHYSTVPANTAKQIKEYLKNRSINLKDVFIPFEPAYESTEFELRNLRQSLMDHIVVGSGFAEEKDFELNIKKPFPKNVTWFVTATFYSSMQGMNVGNYLKRNTVCSWMQTPSLSRRGEIQVDFDLSTSFSCSRKIFDVLQDTIKSTIEEVSRVISKDSSSLSLEIKTHKAGEEGRAVFYLKGTDLAVLAHAKDALDSVLKGECLDHPNIKLILSPGNKKRLQDIEDGAKVFIFKNYSKGSVTIYGSESQINKVMTEINR